jgi:hypothetical protein
MGNDLRNVSAESAQILKNTDAIAVSQDPMAKMGVRVNTTSTAQVWARCVPFLDRIAALFFVPLIFFLGVWRPKKPAKTDHF